MAIDFNSMLMQLQPLRPLDFGSGGGGSLERERLKLAREQFEAEQARAAEVDRLRLLEEQGRNARETLAAQREQERAAREQQAALLTRQQDAMLKAGELAGTGKVQQLRAMAPAFDQLGYNVNDLGSVGGLPVLQFQNRAELAAQEEQAFGRPRAVEGWDEGESANQSLRRMEGEELGYPTNEQGVLDQPAGLPSTEDAYGQALAASQYARENGQPLRGPDEEDYMGAVPRNVLDLPAMQTETLARLNPALAARVAGLPEELQPGAAQTAKAIGGLGLEAPDALTAMDKALEDPVSLYKDRVNDERANAPKALTEMEQSTLRGRGETSAHETAKDQKIPEALETRRQGGMLLEMLDKKDPRIAQVLGPAIMAIAGVKGSQSDRDLAETLGATRQTYLDQGVDWFRQKFIEGGFSEEQKAAFRAWVEEGIEQATLQSFDFMDTARARIRGGNESEQERTGWRNFLMRMPPDIREEYELYSHDRGDTEAEGDVIERQPTAGREPAAGGSIEEELMAQAAEAGLDYEQIAPLVRTESGGDPTIRNKMGSSASGLFQFTDETAKRYGLESAAAYAALPPAEQIRIGLKRFKDIGLNEDSTADDFAMANAAPGYVGKPDSTVIKEYGSDTDFGKDVRAKNPGWIPKGGGEITVGSIKAFYRRHRGEEPETETDEPEKPRTKVEQQILDILR